MNIKITIRKFRKGEWVELTAKFVNMYVGLCNAIKLPWLEHYIKMYLAVGILNMYNYGNNCRDVFRLLLYIETFL